MHEVALAEDLVNMLRKELQERKISPAGKKLTVNVEVGAMSCVVIDSFQFAFQAVCRGSSLAETDLNCQKKQLEIRCENCEFKGEIEEEIPLCPRCESGDTEILAGEDFLLKSIEIGDKNDG